MLLCFGTLPGVARADFEEVRIVRVEPVQIQTCAPAPRTAQSQPPQRQPGAGITGTQILGGAAGAAVGGAVGNQFGSGSGKTAATIAGAGAGAYAGYKLTEQPPAASAAQPPAASAAQPQQQVSPGISGTQALGTAAGAAVGGVVGHQFGSGAGNTAATVAGAGLGAYAGYKLTEGKPAQPPPAPKPGPLAQQGEVQCTIATRHRVEYARANGLAGEVMMTSKPTGPSLLMSFCGDAPCN
jgi:uncharacterized protein YcfJ